SGLIGMRDNQREIDFASKEVVQQSGRRGYGTGNQLSRVGRVHLVFEYETAEQLPAEQQALVQGAFRHEVTDRVPVGRLRKVTPRAGRAGRRIEEPRAQALAAWKREPQKDRVVAHVAAAGVPGQPTPGGCRERLGGAR